MIPLRSGEMPKAYATDETTTSPNTFQATNKLPERLQERGSRALQDFHPLRGRTRLMRRFALAHLPVVPGGPLLLHPGPVTAPPVHAAAAGAPARVGGPLVLLA